jgi:hypothetical protein
MMKYITYLLMSLFIFIGVACSSPEIYKIIETEEGAYVMDKKTGEFYPYDATSVTPAP